MPVSLCFAASLLPGCFGLFLLSEIKPRHSSGNGSLQELIWCLRFGSLCDSQSYKHTSGGFASLNVSWFSTVYSPPIPFMSRAIKTTLVDFPYHWASGTRTDCCPLGEAWNKQFISLRQTGIRFEIDLFGFAMSGSGFLLGSLGWSLYKHFSPGSNQGGKNRERF